jgi:pSer/pThr/pTyr-binding forkhead associated (FHA) protein
MVSFEGKGDVRIEDGRPRLSVVGPNGARADFLVVADEVRIGRSSASDIVLTDATASYAHAMLRRDGDAFEILDLESRNGIYVNGEKAVRRKLHDGDEVLVGRTELKFSWPSEDDSDEDDSDEDNDLGVPSKGQRKVRTAWIAFASRIIAHTLGAAAMIVLGLLIAGGMPSGCGLGSVDRSSAAEISEEQPDSTSEERPAPAPPARPDPNS